MFESAVGIVVVIFVMLGIGFVFERKGWLGANASAVISRLTLRVGMPGLVFSNILKNYDRAMLLGSAVYLLVPLAIMAAMYVLSGFIGKWLRIAGNRRGVFQALFTFGNAIFIGMPVCRAIFGEAAVMHVLLYYLVNTLFWWLIGAPSVARDGGKDTRNPIKRLASPPLVACLVSIALVLLSIKPPAILMTAAEYLGGMVTPLSMLFIGCTLSTMVAGGLRWQKGYGAVLLGRFLVGPAICLPLCLLLGLPADMLGVFMIQSSLPTQTQTCLWAQEHGADAGYAAGAITLSTLMSLFTIPAYAFLLSVLPL